MLKRLLFATRRESLPFFPQKKLDAKEVTIREKRHGNFLKIVRDSVLPFYTDCITIVRRVSASVISIKGETNL